MKFRITYVAFIIGLIALSSSSCYYDDEESLYGTTIACDTTGISFSATVNPIFQTNCAIGACHDATTKSAGYDLSSFAGVTAQDSTVIMNSINQNNQASPMPKGGAKLLDCDIAKIRAWYIAGSPNN